MSEDFRCNIVTLGKTGAGKSSLLNYLFGTTFKTGAGKPVTEAGFFESEQEVNGQKVRVFDSWGIEADKVQKWKGLLSKQAQEHGAKKSPEEWFHAVIYCIQAGGGRIENIDSEIISSFVKDGYRVIVALTKIDQCSPEDEKALNMAILNEIRDSTGKEDSIKIIPVCSEIKQLRTGTTVQSGREELVAAILDSWIDAIRFRIPSAVIGSLQTKLDELREQLSVEVNAVNLSGRPEANEQFVSECREKINARMELLLTEDIGIETQRIFESCKRIGVSLMSILNSDAVKPDFTHVSFENYFNSNQESFKGRMAGYIASLGIFALIRSYAKKFVEEEKNRIIDTIYSDIETQKNILETELKPVLDKAIGEVFEA